jgi:hypothetical protein
VEEGLGAAVMAVGVVLETARRGPPCLPQGPSDYDCAGGTGDGPAYTKLGVVHHVSGSDPYDLDANGNGLGCESPR